MQQYEEPPLFGVAAVPELSQWPPLPHTPVWTEFTGGRMDRCDYCLRWASSAAPPAGLQVRRAVWRRVDPLGSTLLLCDGHARLFRRDLPKTPQ